MKKLYLIIGILGCACISHAAGILTPKGASQRPIEIRAHHAEIVINNGFARTEVVQTFFNPNTSDLEALYSFPLPKSASLSEVTIFAGEKEIHGEVLEKDHARKVYEEEKQSGNDTGKAEKNGFQSFEFSVYPVRAQSAVDRFTSNSYDLVIEGESYRARLKPTLSAARKEAH